MTKKTILFITLVIVMIAFVTACSSQPVDPTSESNEEVIIVETVEVVKEVPGGARGTCGSLTLLYWQAPSIMNPYLGNGTKDFHAASLVLEPLARYSETGELVPWLVEEIPTLENGGISEDLMSITWKIKPGILWSDGTPLTAEDAVFTAEYCMNPDMGCNSLTNFADVESVEALDDLTVRINFDKAKPFPYGPLVSATSPIIQKDQFQDCTGSLAEECSEQNFNPIGTGPFMVKEFRANDVILYDVNENYRDPNKPCFAEVVFKGGGDAASAARAVLETGEADYAWNLQVEPEILANMESKGKAKIVSVLGTAVEQMAINLTNPDPELGDNRSAWTEDGEFAHPFLADFTVRKALSMAIDRNLIANTLYGSAGNPTCNVLAGPLVYASTANDSCLTQDIQGANQLLDEAGIVDTDGDGVREKDGVPLRILFQTSTNSVRQSEQALIKQWWSEIGVETELRNIDGAVYFGGDPASPDTYTKFYADVEMYYFSFDGTDPEAFMGNWTRSEIPSEDNLWLGGNISRWYDPAYEDLVDEMSRTADPDRRIEIAKAMNDMIVQNYVTFPLVHRGSVSAHSNSLLGVRINAWDSELWNIADWTRSSQ